MRGKFLTLASATGLGLLALTGMQGTAQAHESYRHSYFRYFPATGIATTAAATSFTSVTIAITTVGNSNRRPAYRRPPKPDKVCGPATRRLAIAQPKMAARPRREGSSCRTAPLLPYRGSPA